MITTGFILFAAAILAFEAVQTLRHPRFVLKDFEDDLPMQSAVNFRALAGGAPLSSSLFLGGGVCLGVSEDILLGYLGLVFLVVAIIRLTVAAGKQAMGKQYLAVAVEFIAAFVAIYLAAG